MASGDPRVTAVMITHNRRDEVLRSLSKLDEILKSLASSWSITLRPTAPARQWLASSPA